MIPEKATEAAARAMSGHPRGWDQLPEKFRIEYREAARPILEAAAPYLHNPYRDQPVRPSEASLDTVWNYIQSDDPLMTCPACRAAVAWSDKEDHLNWHSTTQREGE